MTINTINIIKIKIIIKKKQIIIIIKLLIKNKINNNKNKKSIYEILILNVIWLIL